MIEYTLGTGPAGEATILADGQPMTLEEALFALREGATVGQQWQELEEYVNGQGAAWAGVWLKMKTIRERIG